MNQYQYLLTPIYQLLLCKTPQEWIDEAKKTQNLSLLLTDHLICELKAAQSAVYLLRKYIVTQEEQDNLLHKLRLFETFTYHKKGSIEALKKAITFTKKINAKSNLPYGQLFIDKLILLINEELHHFIQVLEIMQLYDIPYEHITAGQYAKKMLSHVETFEPNTLIDKLIISAFIEARSCERFYHIAPFLPNDIKEFYISLLRSEARHFKDYLILAAQITPQTHIQQRISFFQTIEKNLILNIDPYFRFHSGIPPIVLS